MKFPTLPINYFLLTFLFLTTSPSCIKLISSILITEKEEIKKLFKKTTMANVRKKKKPLINKAV